MQIDGNDGADAPHNSVALGKKSTIERAISDGYHPFVAAHGYDAYYLNALAGDRRTMACSYDPDLDWVRAARPDLAADPRVPLVPA